MIELPDVERMIESIAGYATGKTVSIIRFVDPGVLNAEPETVKKNLQRRAIAAVERHGRYVVLRFKADSSLLFNLGDDGLLRLESQTTPATDRTRLRFQFAAGRELRFSSSSSDETVQLVKLDAFDESGALQNLGVDPLSDELTYERFALLASKNRRATVKGFFLNQRAIAGIGNDYADEICFQAGIRPDQLVARLTPPQVERLRRYLRRVLRRATLHWTAAHADPGWLINRRSAGSACPRCEHALTSLRVTGRKTVLCTRCQRAA